MISRSYRADVDGLRAIAVLCVVIFHGFPTLLPGGFVGVDIFFVISGYLITGIINSELASNTFSFGHFYARRIRRLAPAMCTMLLAVLGVGWLSLLPSDFAELGLSVVAGIFSASNIEAWLDIGYFDHAAQSKPLLHLWSLGVEEQFYLLWPALLYFVRRRIAPVHLVLAVLMISFVVNLITIHHSPAAAFFLPFSRFWELMAGALLAVWEAKRRQLLSSGLVVNSLALGAFGSIVFSTLLLSAQHPYPGMAAVAPVLGAALLIWTGPSSVVAGVLRQNLPVFVGRVSYPLYLWHWPCLAIPRMVLARNLTDWETGASLGVSFVAALATYALVEQPFRSVTTTSRMTHPLVYALGICACIIATLGWLVSISNGMPYRFPDVIVGIDRNKIDGQFLSREWRGAICLDYSGIVFDDRCIDQDPAGSPVVVLWGDSHAASLYPGLRDIQKRHSFRLAQFNQLSCPPILGFDDPVTILDPYREKCRETNDRVFDTIRSIKPGMVILEGSWWRDSRSPYWLENLKRLRETVGRLKDLGSRVVLFGPLPVWDPFLTTQLIAAWKSDPLHRVPDRLIVDVLRVRDVDLTLSTLAAQTGIEYFSPFQVLCSQKGCLTRLSDNANDLITWDDAHLTPSASRYVVNLAAPLLFP